MSWHRGAGTPARLLLCDVWQIVRELLSSELAHRTAVLNDGKVAPKGARGG